MGKKIDISIVIPAYKEAKRLPNTMHKLEKYIKDSNLTYEVIIVVEPSPDETLELVKVYSKEYDFVRYIENVERLGKGGTVRKGVLDSEGEYVVFMDADGATDLSFINRAYEIMNRGIYKFVIASRAVEGSILTQKQPLFRQFTGWCFRQVTKQVSKLPYNDTQCGCKMTHNSVVNTLYKDIIEEGFAFDVELLMKAKVKGIQVKEVGCTWTDIEGSTVNPIKDGMDMLKAVFRLRKHYY